LPDAAGFYLVAGQIDYLADCHLGDRIPETPHFPELTSWNDLLGAIDVLTRRARPRSTPRIAMAFWL